jgi:rRNA maturation endonuclease Nob1
MACCSGQPYTLFWSILYTQSTGGEQGSAFNLTSNVLCVTADFAMQNVLLQMGMRLMAQDGRQITRCVPLVFVRLSVCECVRARTRACTCVHLRCSF